MDDLGLPETLSEAVRAEFGRAFHAPYETPIVVASNGLLMTAAWLLLPRSWLFHLQGTMAFPMVLASWMYSDVPATNVLGSDSRRVLAALGRPLTLHRLLLAKNAVLWLLVAPLCCAIAFGIGVSEQRWITTLLTIVGITIVPLGALGLGAVVGARWPYHPRPLRWRWEHRRERTITVRWLLLVLVPYGIIPGLCALMALPSLLVWAAFSDSSLTNLTDGEFAIGALLACAVGAVTWQVGQRTVLWLVRRRHDQLAGYLADPDRG